MANFAIGILDLHLKVISILLTLEIPINETFFMCVLNAPRTFTCRK